MVEGVFACAGGGVGLCKFDEYYINYIHVLCVHVHVYSYHVSHMVIGWGAGDAWGWVGIAFISVSKNIFVLKQQYDHRRSQHVAPYETGPSECCISLL